ncbi:hypothetical protein NC651_032854 [Populus alba x Populus x berolinensis]|nr:hypothetical protein NC651_032854 [Populus alba x Populus x berolinensis]
MEVEDLDAIVRDGGLSGQSFGFGEGLLFVNEDTGVLWFHFLLLSLC